MKIVSKIIIDFLVVVMMVAAMGYIGYINIVQVNASLRIVNNHIVPSLSSLKDMKNAVLRVLSSSMEKRFLNNRMTGSSENNKIKDENQLIAEGVELFNKSLGRYGTSYEGYKEDNEEIMIAEIRDKWNTFLSLSEKMVYIGSSTDISAMLEHKESLEAAEIDLLDTIEGAIEDEEREISTWTSLLDKSMRQYINLVIGLIMITFFLVLISVFRNYRSFSIKEESEKKLAEINKQWISSFNAMPDGAFMADIYGKLINTNKSLDDMLGKKINKNNAVVEDVFGSLGINIDFNVFKTDEGVNTKDMRAPKTDKWYSIIRADVIDQNNKTKGWLYIIRNITGAKKMEESLASRNEELEKFRLIVVDRELRMIELKKKIKELQEKIDIKA